jgi:SAM-dependent methyltransferase
MTEADIRRRYTELADVYIQMFGAGEHVDPEDLEFLARNLGHCDGTVLDAGCGPGHLTAYLTDLGLTARGIDLVPDFIDSARSNWPKVEFTVGSMKTLDIPGRSLRGILAWYCRIDNVPEGGRTPLHSRTTSVTQGRWCVYGVISGEQWSGIPPGTP